MSRSLDQLTLELKSLSHNTRSEAGRILRTLCVEAHSTLVEATPVDKGRARGNWTVSIGVPALEEKDVVSDDLPRLMAEAREIISTADADSSVYITNNLPYIQRLNDGWSKQAPKAFIDTALMNAVDALPESLAKIS